MTLVLIGKDLVLEGSTTKIEDKQVPGIYIYIHIYVSTHMFFHYSDNFQHAERFMEAGTKCLHGMEDDIR